MQETDAMPHKRSTPSPQSLRVVRRSTPLAWRVLLQRALRARQAGEWQEVGRLLTLLDTAPDRPPSDPPSRDVQAWGTLQADYWDTSRSTGRSGRARLRRRLGRSRSWPRWRARRSRPSCVGSWTRWMRLGH